eukprot:TRINITY_DN12523_c0_g3_i1.p1 TRINITY_DN12523_c0_g3~~TRINITY_DN12523_c0_g3_i1.p1  ORF type:complete len:157 (-),score=48.35 TRINITY_DN12523_c0_g3_i1:65-535(-)
MKALQVMQLALQYLNYSQQILVQKIQTTKLYIEKQKEQVHMCQDIDKKQKAKIRSYKKAIEGLNQQAQQYELLAKRVCPELFDKNKELLKTMSDNEHIEYSKTITEGLNSIVKPAISKEKDEAKQREEDDRPKRTLEPSKQTSRDYDFDFENEESP